MIEFITQKLSYLFEWQFNELAQEIKKINEKPQNSKFLVVQQLYIIKPECSNNLE